MRWPSLALLAAAICLTGAAAPPGPIHAIDWKNYIYPWAGEELTPSGWSWLSPLPSNGVRLANGVHKFEPDFPHGSYLAFQSVTYGDLNGDGHDEAAVDLLYGTGGTANWDYLYVFTSRNGRPALLAILRSGSRAGGGLVRVDITNKLLTLDFLDPDRRSADCCSRGIVRVSYRLENGNFVQALPETRDSLRLGTRPLPEHGPGTVDTRDEGGQFAIIYRTVEGRIRALTQPGEYSEPASSPDGRRVAFLNSPGGGLASELWLVNTDGSALRELFHGPIEWNGAPAPATAEIRWPQWSADGHFIYFVVDIDQITGALFRLDADTGATKLFLRDVVNYEILPTGRHKGSLIANQRTMEPSEGYNDYPYYLFSPSGEKIQRIGDEEEDIDALVNAWISK